MTAHLYEQQISTGVIPVVLACCQPVLQSSSEQWGSFSALTVLQCFGAASLVHVHVARVLSMLT